ncbi:acetyl-CoA hydrolase/transferase family protein [Mobilicoccus pelagius]|uniref:Putative 4-hydroxybutyrate CoA-transferase n=1 Tax=Mobilicoccus pelagius NBRC 104925 TaxID=1089455 RepID=H5UMK2_9MICO|nr:acetyl-CoA hydrolase/transferase C-terminal domain-containing protein [Mobilicoccus pelagius]GAB46960.1 putative 4-hydroxybutyrate CoA-transferase [Mobilicoccus pelagius NBRC 104925]
MTAQDQYAAKRREAGEAVGLIEDGSHVIVPTGVGEPPTILETLSERRTDFRDITVHQILPLREYGYYDPETVEHVRHSAYFLGGPTRAGAQAGWIDYRPSYFSEMPALIRDGLFPADVVVAMASPMDAHGYFSLGLAPDYTMAALEKARTVVLEVNPNVPYAYGHCHIHVDQVTAIVEDDRPLLEVGLPQIGPVQEAIAGHVADLIPDGATLQIGYGGIPDAVVMQLLEKRDLGIHTEMFGDGILSLVESGAVTNLRKNVDRGLMKATFALGSRRLYDFMDHNPALEMHPVDVTNDPYLVGRHDDLHSINGTMQIDLVGQCGSESLGPKPYSGTGGQSDFVRASNRSRGGKAFIVLPSTAKNDTITRIVPTLTPGTHVSTSKNDVDYVVTEYGVARLRGRSAHQRAEALIEIAHPNFRGQLIEEAEKLRVF